MDTLDIIEETTLTVSALNQYAKALLEGAFPIVRVTGEISNFACPRSGHWYFTLKDAGAQVRCAMFRGANRRLGFVPKDGEQVTVQGKLSLYAERGDYQLIGSAMEATGEGALQQAYEALKKRLAAEGLFDTDRKLPLPKFPEKIAIITSETGAAIRDMLRTLHERFPVSDIYVVPTLVQGAKAAPAIIKAIKLVNETQTDVILLGRGGGSMEDLWAFNEEAVARAIAESEIPIITGIGHESDVTIADFVADVRAATPTMAAAYATPDAIELSSLIGRYETRMTKAIENLTERYALKLEAMEQRFFATHPGRAILQFQGRLAQLFQRLCAIMHAHYNQAAKRFVLSTQLMDACSPLATLARGYAMALDEAGHVIISSDQISIGEEVQVQVAKGGFTATVSALKEVDSETKPKKPVH